MKTESGFQYFLSSCFGLLVAAVVGGVTYLFVAVLLADFDLSPPDADNVAAGVGILIAMICVLAQLWCYATRDRLRNRQLPSPANLRKPAPR